MYAVVRFESFEERIQSFAVPEGTSLEDIFCSGGLLTLDDVEVDVVDDDFTENGMERSPTHVELVDAAT